MIDSEFIPGLAGDASLMENNKGANNRRFYAGRWVLLLAHSEVVLSLSPLSFYGGGRFFHE